jgi:acyl-[acyl-carrier-protein]-phospholipid O-acyltransferase/long-chain-fatty-acid--[acyl-carrier-protein] ligase
MSDTRAPLWNRGFISLLFTQFFEAASDNIIKDTIVFAAAVAGPWEKVFGEGGSGLIAVIFSAPFIVLSAFGGRIADRYSKSRITVILKTLSLVVCAMCAIGFARGSAYGAVAALVAFATVSSFFGPVKYGMIAELVDQKELSRANGILNMATNVAVIVGGIVAGIVVTDWKDSFVDGSPTGVAAWHPGIAMAVAVVLGFLTCLTLPKLKPQNPSLPVDLNPFSTYIATLREMAKSPLLAVCAAWTFFYFVASVVLLILPDYSSFLAVKDNETALLKAGLGVAIGVGCVVAAYLDSPARRWLFVPAGAGGLALSFILLGLAPPNYWLTMGLLTLTGLTAGFYIIPLQSMLQEYAPDASRGRVLGTANGVSFLMGLLGGVLFFALRGGAHLESHRVFLVVGGLCAAAAWVTLAWLRRHQRKVA